MRDLQQSSVFVPDLQTKIMWFKLMDVQVSCQPLNACKLCTPSPPSFCLHQSATVECLQASLAMHAWRKARAFGDKTCCP